MIKNTQILVLLLTFLTTTSVFPQTYSFENNKVPDNWEIDKGTINTTRNKYKAGKQSLQINWKQGAVLTLTTPNGLSEACKSKNGGINTWIYNESPTEEPMIFFFKDSKGKEVCQLPFLLNFKGWRCIWAKFQNDMNMPAKSNINTVELHFPQHTSKGITYIDLLEFTPRVSWQNMSDAQYKVNRTDHSLIPNFIGYRNTKPQTDKVISATDIQIKNITDRLTAWYFGSNQQATGVSHLLGLYPGYDITNDTPDVFNAARKSLDIRGNKTTGWSMAWKVSLWARLYDASKSYEALTNLINYVNPKIKADNQGGLYRNLLNALPFQIDGNFGATAGIAEMLLQSHKKNIHLLPALPLTWKKGSIKGVKARGGYTVDMEWKKGKIIVAYITSPYKQTANIQYKDQIIKSHFNIGERKKNHSNDRKQGLYTFQKGILDKINSFFNKTNSQNPVSMSFSTFVSLKMK